MSIGGDAFVIYTTRSMAAETVPEPLIIPFVAVKSVQRAPRRHLLIIKMCASLPSSLLRVKEVGRMFGVKPDFDSTQPGHQIHVELADAKEFGEAIAVLDFRSTTFPQLENPTPERTSAATLPAPSGGAGEQHLDVLSPAQTAAAVSKVDVRDSSGTPQRTQAAAVADAVKSSSATIVPPRARHCDVERPSEQQSAAEQTKSERSARSPLVVSNNTNGHSVKDISRDCEPRRGQGGTTSADGAAARAAARIKARAHHQENSDRTSVVRAPQHAARKHRRAKKGSDASARESIAEDKPADVSQEVNAGQAASDSQQSTTSSPRVLPNVFKTPSSTISESQEVGDVIDNSDDSDWASDEPSAKRGRVTKRKRRLAQSRDSGAGLDDKSVVPLHAGNRLVKSRGAGSARSSSVRRGRRESRGTPATSTKRAASPQRLISEVSHADSPATKRRHRGGNSTNSVAAVAEVGRRGDGSVEGEGAEALGDTDDERGIGLRDADIDDASSLPSHSRYFPGALKSPAYSSRDRALDGIGSEEHSESGWSGTDDLARAISPVVQATWLGRPPPTDFFGDADTAVRGHESNTTRGTHLAVDCSASNKGLRRSINHPGDVNPAITPLSVGAISQLPGLFSGIAADIAQSCTADMELDAELVEQKFKTQAQEILDSAAATVAEQADADSRRLQALWERVQNSGSRLAAVRQKQLEHNQLWSEKLGALLKDVKSDAGGSRSSTSFDGTAVSYMRRKGDEVVKDSLAKLSKIEASDKRRRQNILRHMA